MHRKLHRKVVIVDAAMNELSKTETSTSIRSSLKLLMYKWIIILNTSFIFEATSCVHWRFKVCSFIVKMILMFTDNWAWKEVCCSAIKYNKELKRYNVWSEFQDKLYSWKMRLSWAKHINIIDLKFWISYEFATESWSCCYVMWVKCEAFSLHHVTKLHMWM